MLKVNLLFIVKKAWFRQPLYREYVTFPADRSSQQRPANMTTFGEPLVQPSGLWEIHILSACYSAEYMHLSTFNFRILYQTGKLDQLLRGTQNLPLNIIGI